MSEYARVENGIIIERRVLDFIPEHKRDLWRPVVYEGSGPLSDIYIEPEQVRVVLSEPPVTIEDVRAEAQRRIIVLTGTTNIINCLIKQHNAQMRATELTLIKATGGLWTESQAAEAAALQSMADAIRAIRAASNILEVSLPKDFADNKYWPNTPGV